MVLLTAANTAQGYLNTARYAFDEDTDEEEEEEDLETPAGLRPPPNRFAHIKVSSSCNRMRICHRRQLFA